MNPTPTTDNRTMLVSPAAALLRSRKTIVALVTALVNVIVLLIPSLESVQGELVTILTILGTVLIASISHEDAASKGQPTTINASSGGDTNITPPAPASPTPTDLRG